MINNFDQFLNTPNNININLLGVFDETSSMILTMASTGATQFTAFPIIPRPCTFAGACRCCGNTAVRIRRVFKVSLAV